jgi:hypothetical protein
MDLSEEKSNLIFLILKYYKFNIDKIKEKIYSHFSSYILDAIYINPGTNAVDIFLRPTQKKDTRKTPIAVRIAFNKFSEIVLYKEYKNGFICNDWNKYLKDRQYDEFELFLKHFGKGIKIFTQSFQKVKLVQLPEDEQYVEASDKNYLKCIAKCLGANAIMNFQGKDGYVIEEDMEGTPFSRDISLFRGVPIVL